MAFFVAAGCSIPIERCHANGVRLRQAQHEEERNGGLVQFGTEFVGAGGDGPLAGHAWHKSR